MSKIKIIALLIALAMLLTACAGQDEEKSVEAQGQETQGQGTQGQGTVDGGEAEQERGTVIGGVRIIEAGQVTGKCGFVSGGFLTRTQGEQQYILDLNGEAKLDKPYDDLYAIVGNGVCVVRMDSEDVPQFGVVNAYTGQELVPCEAAEIEKLSDRYLRIYYWTGEGTQEDHFNSYYDTETYEEVYYKGYSKIFDLEKGQFVPGLENATPAGDMLYVSVDYKTKEVFDADGKSVGTYEYLYAFPNSELGMQWTEEGIIVYDGSFKEVGRLKGDINDYDTINGVDNMLMTSVVVKGVHMDQLVDLNGEAISEPMEFILPDYSAQYCCRGTLTDDGPWGAMDHEGNVLVPFEYDVVRYVKPGYFLAFKNDETGNIQEGDLYSLTGEKLNTESVTGDFNECAFYTDSGIFAPETGEVIPVPYYKEYLGCGLIEVSVDTYESTIYSTLTGEVVFEGVKGCVCTGNNLYIWDSEEEVYTRYILEWA